MRHNADPLLSVFQPIRSGQYVTVASSSPILLRSIPHLYKLAEYPVVIHIALQPLDYPDYSEITAIRQCGFIFLQSETLQEVQDTALSAHALAIKSGKGVIHFYSARAVELGQEISFEDVNLISRVVDLEAVRSFQRSPIGGSTIYVDDGRVASIDVASSQFQRDGSQDVSASAEKSLSREESRANSSTETSSKGTSTRESSSDRDTASSAATSVEPLVSRPVTSEDISLFLTNIWSEIEKFSGRKHKAFKAFGSAQAEYAVLIFGADATSYVSALKSANSPDEFRTSTIITVSLYRPWTSDLLAAAIPPSVKRIAVLEQMHKRSTKWGPVFMDVLLSMKGSRKLDVPVVSSHLGFVDQSSATTTLRGVLQNLLSENPIQNMEFGQKRPQLAFSALVLPKQPELENAYIRILAQLFAERLCVLNQDSSTIAANSDLSSNPEFALGRFIARRERRKQFIENMKQIALPEYFTTDGPSRWLNQWIPEAENAGKANALAPEVISRLSVDGSASAAQILEMKGLLYEQSHWIIGSDAWAYDLGNSGVHHALVSGENVNMLIIDSQPYCENSKQDSNRRKKDIGLYAMNFGNAYVASVAVYGSYTQVLQAMIEADEFNGPSIVLAYLPYELEHDSPLSVLQNTKKAIDIGYWPLYRWNPGKAAGGEPDFQLDSEHIKEELKKFLRRDNYMSQLMKRHPEYSANLASSYGSEVRATQKRKAKDAYSKLLEGLTGAPVTILYASDNGNTEALASRLSNRARARGLKSTVMAMDDYPFEDLTNEENIVLMTSTAGQGEFPQNGRQFWEAVRNASTIDLATVKFAVFALGDSHYWPRKEDRMYYNKPGKDLHAKFSTFGGQALTECGLGDDQDPDGYQTGYAEWEPKLWQALGVDNVEGLPEEPPPLTNEDIKTESNYLRGTIMEGLKDESTGAISASDQQLTKFHGTYQQDDRDLREQRKVQGLEPAYSFMIRCRLPGGIATPSQWLQMDAISTKLGNETMKLTTRQTFQFHGVVKGKLRPAMQAINRALMTTIAACGDVNRNIMCTSLLEQTRYHAEVYEVSKKINDHLLPSTTAYHEIWLKEDNDTKTQIAGDALVDYEPLYGPTYLPRKFKITIAIPPRNDTDVYAHDIGLIAIQGKDGRLLGFNVLAGGGMGVTHNNKKTYPRTGSMLGYVPAEEIPIVCEKIMLVQRDHGDRKNRKHARLKYTIDDMGVDIFKQKVEERWGSQFEKAWPFKFRSNVDTFGWQKDDKEMNHFTFFIENGRIEDTVDFPMKTGLRELAKVHKGEFRLTGNQHLILSGIADEDMPKISGILSKYKLDNTNFTGLRLSSSACVAFPTCGLAMAESERYLPSLISKLEGALEEHGLGKESIVMRMTGCPNGCARPWLAEVAFVGKAYGAYNMYLGGGYHGQRLNKLYRSSIKEDEILVLMKGLLKQYALERESGERFGDFCIRAGIIKETREGKDFHADVSLKTLSYDYNVRLQMHWLTCRC